jgi:hypothetical protein
MNITDDTDYDVVINTLQEKRDHLWRMTKSNMNIDMMNIMDDIRLEQIEQLDRAIAMWLLWKEEKCRTERTETKE